MLENEFVIENKKIIRCDSESSVITIPEEVETIGQYAFACNKYLEKVILPNVKMIEKASFFGCENLKEVQALNVSVIKESAFERSEKLETVILSNKLKKIENFAFNKCKNIEFDAPTGSFAEKYASQNDIYCKCSFQGNEKISLKSVLSEQKKKAKKIKPMLNLNAMVLGGSGTGKSRFIVEPNLLQGNTSFVVTDPSGELVKKCGKALERLGYKIKVFNLDDMNHSHNYNPFRYIRDENGNISHANVMKMINVIMKNTKGEGEGGDPFWDDATRLLLSAMIFLLIETGDEEEQNLCSILQLLHKANVNENKPDEKGELDLIFEGRGKEEPNALSFQFYTEFKQAAGKTMQSILISTTTRLQSFKTEEMKNLTSQDNIELEKIGDEKTALFVILPTTDSTNNFLAAMMFTQLFDTLYNRAIHKYDGRLPIHTRFILDEFKNIGKIPEIEKILATCRKFEISIIIILQNITQLKTMYKEGWEELPGNCDTMIYLGGKDQFTNEYIMKELGKETIDTLAINKTKSRQGSTSYNDGIMGRELMQLSELSTMDNNDCIVMIRGLHPFLTAKFEITNHRRYAMLDEANPERNTYFLSENVVTAESPISVSYDEFFDDNDFNIEDWDIESVKVNFMSDEDEPLIPIQELKNILGIPEKISQMFENLTLTHKTIKV